MENYQFTLVRESLKEREVIYRIAPSITNPVPFIIPHTRKLRPAWLIKMGLLLYDNLGGKTRVPKSSIPQWSIQREEYEDGYKNLKNAG